MSSEIVVVEEAPGAELAPHEVIPPKEVMKYAQAAAREIVGVARSGKLLANVGGREYPMTECMTLIGNMTGHTVKVEWCRPVPDEWGIGKGWEARAVVINREGREVAGAESMCLRSERAWSKRDEFAVRSMAQTRASGKALRLALGYIVTLAGWEALPAEEITDEMRSGSKPAVAPAPAPAEEVVVVDDDDFDAQRVTDLLKAEFGAEVVKAAYKEEKVARYADVTRDNEAALRQRCEQIALAQDPGAAA